MKKTIKRNLYAASDVMAVIALLLLFLSMVEKKSGMFIGACFAGGIGLVTAGIQGLKGRAKIENESGETVYTKSEDGCDAVELEDGAFRYDIDGVKNQGRTYKLVDGVHGVAKKDGTVKVKSLTGRLANYINGGGALAAPPDSCWEPLFKA